MTGAQIPNETQVEQGDRRVFVYPGGFVLNIYYGSTKTPIGHTHYITCHEQRGPRRGRLCPRTGKGRGDRHLRPWRDHQVTGNASRHLDSTPMVAITGNVPSTSIGRDGFQEVDITGVTMPITKHNYIVKDVKKLASTVREAFRIARSGRPGPMLIDIPKDVQLALWEYERVEPAVEAKPLRHREGDFERAVKLIGNPSGPSSTPAAAWSSRRVRLTARALPAAARAHWNLYHGADRRPAGLPLFLGMTGMHG
jgi:acetolactate synthase-1/2/3 large subunit